MTAFRSLAFAFATSAALITSAAYAADAAANRAEVESIVRDLIKKEPQIIVDALKGYQEKMQQEQQEKAAKLLKDRQGDLVKNAPVVGNGKADVTVVQFFDYHCGYCKKMLPVINQLLKEDKNVRIVFREFPILSQDSQTAAKAAIAVYNINPAKYFEFHSALMNASGKFDEAALMAQAKKIGIDPDKLKKEMAKPAVEEELKATAQLASDLGVRGTPAVIIGDQLVPGAMSIEALKQAVADARKKK